jgi:hypothetical protein
VPESDCAITMNALAYYWRMACSRLSERKLPGDWVLDGMVRTTAKRDRLNQDRRVIIHLDDPLMHVGDQMFFRPLAWRLREAGYNVAVKSTTSLAFLFEDLPRPAPVAQPGALVITRSEALGKAFAIYGADADYFAFRLTAKPVRSPVANVILDAVVEWFGIEGVHRGIDRTCLLNVAPDPVALVEKLHIPTGRPLIILSNYIDSGRLRKLPWREREMLHRAALLKREMGGVVLHLGTAADLAADRRDYSALVDRDLRGRTSVRDLFDLMAVPGIGAVLCFDTAILHIANIFKLNTVVYWKYRRSRAERERVRAVFARFYEACERS